MYWYRAILDTGASYCTKYTLCNVCTGPQVVAMDACRSNLISNATQEAVNRAAGHLDEIPQKISLLTLWLSDLRGCIKTQLLLSGKMIFIVVVQTNKLMMTAIMMVIGGDDDIMSSNILLGLVPSWNITLLHLSLHFFHSLWSTLWIMSPCNLKTWK